MKYKYLSVFCGLPLLVFLIFIACEAPNQPTYGPDNPDPNPTGLSAATVTSISPTEGYLKDIITISGSGFDSNPEFNLVAFGSKTGILVSATENELKVIAPNINDQDVKVKVAIKGSEFWSNELDFTFNAAVVILNPGVELMPRGQAIDDEGNHYIGYGDDPGAIYKVPPDGEATLLVEVPVHGAIHFGPGGYLYACTKWESKIIRISRDGSVLEDYVEVTEPTDFDWDPNGNMFISGWEGIWRLNTGGTLTQLNEEGCCSCRYFDGYLYVAMCDGYIGKYPVTNGELGELETHWEHPDGACLMGMDIDENGAVYSTPDWQNKIIKISPEGNDEAIFEGELIDHMRYISIQGKFLYGSCPCCGTGSDIVRVYLGGVQQAPNYGVQ